MKSFTKKYIITGAPGTGKTKLINVLEKQYPCIHEVSRKVIMDEQKKGGDGMPWQDIDRFTQLVYEAFIVEISANPHALFTDRSMLDLIAYLRVEGKSVPSPLDQFPYNNKFFKTVFLAPTWEAIFHKDKQRLQEFDYCLELEKALIDAYEEKGFEIVWLPKGSTSDRSVFVEERINR
ncbi:MAG: AAA family ATPase [Bacteroidota bacterium]